MARCIAEVARGRDDIVTLCVSSLYGGAGIPVDADVNPLYPCLIWMDRRAEAQVAWVRAHVDMERLGAITDNLVDISGTMSAISGTASSSAAGPPSVNS